MEKSVVKTVDIILIYKSKWLVLIERAKPPFADKLVIPGGHVEEGEDILEAAVREVAEEVGLHLTPGLLSYLTTLASPNRDPRGIYVSTVFTAAVFEMDFSSLRAGSDAKTIHLMRLDEIRPDMIGFDHYEAIKLLIHK
ncbi:MAG: NUDIX hydrolase [Candidatus Magasanikbacteria bacterium]|nr:NUDIX hydrolase [Candidatus Magasanikbacteria bacterium]